MKEERALLGEVVAATRGALERVRALAADLRARAGRDASDVETVSQVPEETMASFVEAHGQLDDLATNRLVRVMAVFIARPVSGWTEREGFRFLEATGALDEVNAYRASTRLDPGYTLTRPSDRTRLKPSRGRRIARALAHAEGLIWATEQLLSRAEALLAEALGLAPDPRAVAAASIPDDVWVWGPRPDQALVWAPLDAAHDSLGAPELSAPRFLDLHCSGLKRRVETWRFACGSAWASDMLRRLVDGSPGLQRTAEGAASYVCWGAANGWPSAGWSPREHMMSWPQTMRRGERGDVEELRRRFFEEPDFDRLIAFWTCRTEENSSAPPSAAGPAGDTP